MSIKNDESCIYDKLKLSPVARKVAEEIRETGPIRRVGGGKKNSVCRFASPKMGRVIQAESRYVELPLVIQWEWRPDVHRFDDQPFLLTLRYRTSNGTKKGHHHVPDYFLVTDQWAGFIEAKSRADAEACELKCPEVMCRDDEGNWISPAGIRAAQEFDLGYHLHVADQVDQAFVRNIHYLWDYIQSTPSDDTKSSITQIQQQVRKNKTVPLSELQNHYGVEPVYFAIAKQKVYVRIHQDLISNTDDMMVFADAQCSAIQTYTSTDRISSKHKTHKFQCGDTLIWDEIHWTVINVGKQKCSLRSPDGTVQNLQYQVLNELVRDGQITFRDPWGEPHKTRLAELLEAASPNEIKRVVQRARILHEYGAGDPKANHDVPARTIRHWRKAWKNAERKYGEGIVGLFDKRTNAGNRTPRVHGRADELIQKAIQEFYATKDAPNVKAAYVAYCVEAETAKVPAISYAAFNNRIKKADRKTLTQKRHGQKREYQLGPDKLHTDSLNAILPTVGDKAFSVSHEDHTILPVDLLSEITRDNIGTVHLSVLLDAYSTTVLAHILSLEKPSYRNTMLLMRECVRRHQRLPNTVVVDQGSDLLSDYFDFLLARYKVHKVERPAGAPRHGSAVESTLGRIERAVIRQLKGNTGNAEPPRSMSRSHDPKAQAVWTISALDDLLEHYLYTTFPNERHAGIDDIPSRLFDSSIRTAGSPSDIHVAYDRDFFITTLPEVSGATRVIRNGQITVNHLAYRSSEISLSRYNKEKVPVRHDPYDPTRIYVYVENIWHECITIDRRLRRAVETCTEHVELEIQGNARLTGREYRSVSDRARAFKKMITHQEQRLHEQRVQNIQNPCNLVLENIESEPELIEEDPDRETDLEMSVCFRGKEGG